MDKVIKIEGIKDFFIIKKDDKCYWRIGDSTWEKISEYLYEALLLENKKNLLKEKRYG